MDDNGKNICAHQVDQELLDARGIDMTVDEVAGLSTSKYSERVQSLKLCDEDLAFLKGLRRRIKNRLASQNSRRRSVEHLRRLTRELRAVRACRRAALGERRALVARRDRARDTCAALRGHLTRILQERSDPTEVPSIDIEIEPPKQTRKISVVDTKIPDLIPILPDQHISVIVKNDTDREKLQEELENEVDIYERVRQELQKEIQKKEPVNLQNGVRDTVIIKEESPDYEEITIDDEFDSVRTSFDKRRDSKDFVESFDERRMSHDINSYESSDDLEMRKYDDLVHSSSERDIFECKIGKLVTQSVNHIYNDKRKIFAKTVFISNDKLSSDIKTMVLSGEEQNAGVLNLSVKEGRRKSHGRKQSAPRRIAYYNECEDGVLDLKVKKETQ